MRVASGHVCVQFPVMATLEDLVNRRVVAKYALHIRVSDVTIDE